MDNTGKKLFSTGYSRPHFEGVVVKETDKTFTVSRANMREFRTMKDVDHILLPGDADVEAAQARYEAAWASRKAEVERLTGELANAKKEQRKAAREALERVSP